MKVIAGLLLIILLGGMLHSFLPWWCIVLPAVLAGVFLKLGSWTSFITGFAGAGLLWGFYAAWINAANEGILAWKMGVLLGDLNGLALIGITIGIGGLLGGLGALTGYFTRQLFQ